MKILTKEEEKAHYNATLKGGITGGAVGMIVGAAAVYGANARFHGFRQLTLPLKTFLVTSSTTFAAIVNADRYSRNFENARDPGRQYRDKSSQDQDQIKKNESTFQKLKDWGRENRYPIVTASWVASMAISIGLVGRNPYLTGAQKLVQARVYAQGLTLAVLIATAAFEVGDASKGKGRWETVKILDPNDPEHKHMIEKKIHHEAYAGEDLWRDMVATEERKIAARKSAANSNSNSNSKSEETSSASKPSEDKHSKESPSSSKSSQDKTPKEVSALSGKKEQEAASSNNKVDAKSAKAKIISQTKTAGKPVREDAHEHEEKNQQAQAERLSDAKTHSGGEPKVKDRGEYSG